MAHSPQVKAAAQADLLAGKTIRQVSKNRKIPSATVADWDKELKTGQNRAVTATTIEVRRSKYETALEKFAVAVFDMLSSQAELMTNQDYIRNKATSDIVQHTEFLAGRLLAFAEMHRSLQNPGVGASQGPAPTAEPVPALAEENSA